jgi:hypothetical protein
MRFRDVLLSDGDWSDDDDDHGDMHLNDDEMEEHIDVHLSDHLQSLTETTMKPFYRVGSTSSQSNRFDCLQVNIPENHLQLQFFARLFGPRLEAMLHCVDDHIQKHARMFHWEKLGDCHRSFHFRKQSFISNRCSPRVSA